MARDGKGCLSLGPRSAVKVSFHLLPIPASFVMCLLTSAVSEKEVETRIQSEWGCVEGTW